MMTDDYGQEVTTTNSSADNNSLIADNGSFARRIDINETRIDNIIIINPNFQNLIEAKIAIDFDLMLQCTTTLESISSTESTKATICMKNIALLINSHPKALNEKDFFYGRNKSKELAAIPPSLLFQQLALHYCDKKFVNTEKNPNGYYNESISRKTAEKTEARWNSFEEWYLIGVILFYNHIIYF